MPRMKYIIGGRLQHAIVFDEILTHRDVARAVFHNQEITGAGFCYIDEGRFFAYGESISLKVKSGPNDSKILNKSLLGV